MYYNIKLQKTLNFYVGINTKGLNLDRVKLDFDNSSFIYPFSYQCNKNLY